MSEAVLAYLIRTRSSRIKNKAFRFVSTAYTKSVFVFYIHMQQMKSSDFELHILNELTHHHSVNLKSSG